MGPAGTGAAFLARELVGRDPERTRIAEVLAEARRGRSGTLVLVGDAGVGKSALCGWAREQAADMRILAAQGVESEADLPYAGLAELCVGELDRLGELPRPQARALDGALARADAQPVDRFAIGAAVLSLLGLAAEGRPLLVVVDDAHWLDASSADALLFAARRLRNEGVAVLVGTRPAGVFGVATPGLPQLTLGGLDATAARAVLEAAHPGLPASVAQTLVERTEGNPLALLEVPRMLSERQRAAQESVDDPLPVGPTLTRALTARLAGLPVPTRRAVLVAAAHGSGHMQEIVAALLVIGLVPESLDPAERAGVLTLGPDTLEFRHPLLRAAVYHDAVAADRRAAHAALAEATTGENRAWHLARAASGPDESVAALLERVGLDARRRGAPAAAAAAHERAAILSGSAEQRRRRLGEAAHDAHVAGRSAQAVRLLDEALAAAPRTLERAALQHLRGHILVLQGHTEAGSRVLVEEAERLRGLAPDRAAMMLVDVALQRVLSTDFDQTVELVREAYAMTRESDVGVQAVTGSMLAGMLVMTGETTESVAVLDRHLPALRSADPLGPAAASLVVAAQACVALERHDLAAELLDAIIAAGRRASAPSGLVWALSTRADVNLRLGRWDVASAEAEEAASLGDEMAQSVFAAYAVQCSARLAASVGDERRCREAAGRATQLMEAHGNRLGQLHVHAALGLLELGLGRVEAAIRELEAARRSADRHRLRQPAFVHWQADLVEAYVRARRPDAAEAALAELEEQGRRTGGRWARGVAARCRALLSADERAEELFAEAIEHLEAVAEPFDVARAHLALGEHRRRTGRRTEARRGLRTALEAFDELGAAPWCARAEAELRATGAAPRRRGGRADPDQLTAHELQVARIIAGGASNREAASALFLSTKTIEFHLTQIYRKLGLRNRGQLAALAATRGWLDGNSS